MGEALCNWWARAFAAGHTVSSDSQSPVTMIEFAERRLGGGSLVTTEVMVAEKPKKETAPAMPPLNSRSSGRCSRSTRQLVGGQTFGQPSTFERLRWLAGASVCS
jgi:hypothetical protein